MMTQRLPLLLLLTLLSLLALHVRLSGAFLASPSLRFRQRMLTSSSSSSRGRLLFLFAAAKEEQQQDHDDDKGDDDDSSESYPDDPRAFRRTIMKQKEQQKASRRRRLLTAKEQEAEELAAKRRQGEAASAAMDLPEQPLVRTIGGGTNMIFEMARRMFETSTTGTDESQQQQQQQQDGSTTSSSSNKSLPRWHPSGMMSSNASPQARTQALIWRNARKRNKPSLWRYALRTYNNRLLLQDDDEDEKNQGGVVPIKTNAHHEGALVACAKLGLWQRALEIYRHVEKEQEDQQQALRRRDNKLLKKNASPNNKRNNLSNNIQVTDSMVLSLVRACVRAARQHSPSQDNDNDNDNASIPPSLRRAPLDAAMQVLQEVEDKHQIPLVARHVNPIASAYQSLGLMTEATHILQTYLTDRTSRVPEPEDADGEEEDRRRHRPPRFNVHDLGAKDKASYTLLVKGAVSNGDWAGAVDALYNMTEKAGLYPNSRHLNAWTEVSERKTKHRTTRSWKKKREEYWLESVQ